MNGVSGLIGRRVTAAVLCLAIGSSGLPQFAFAQAESGQQKPLSQMLSEREQRGAERNRGTGSKIFGAVVTIGVLYACGGFSQQQSAGNKVLCSAGAALAGYGAYMLSREITKKLKEKDQKQVLAAASESLRTGEPATLELPDSNATASVGPVKTIVAKEADVDVIYDASRITNLTKIDVVAEPYFTGSQIEIRDAPAATGRITAKLPPKSTVYVAGRVDADWYMVAERITDGGSEAKMIVGYVSAKSLKPVGSEVVLASHQMPTTATEGKVRAVLRCGEMEFQVRDAQGQTAKGKSAMCRGPEGLAISA